ncbi:unnamed protein product [Rangifer tarandus platyrhynchus]|uniref:Uncharacterized protein n=1 Tax=Rangifer tarandus platyrhynchus TaxID=3082113 RepID=A0ABN8YWP2_RANTA|nr:unnamed protein product [Rangifer tarandus platyrhynchus]
MSKSRQQLSSSSRDFQLPEAPTQVKLSPNLLLEKKASEAKWRCSPPRRSTRGRQGGVEGVVVGEAWAAALRRDPPARPSPRTPAPDRPGTGWDRAPSAQLRTRALGPPSCLPCPSPHPELREPQTPSHWTPSSELGTGDLYSTPDPENQTSPRSPRDAPGPWGVRPSVSHPVPPGTRARPPGGPGSPGLDRAGTWPGRAGPRSRPPPLSPFKRFLPLCPFGGLHLH